MPVNREAAAAAIEAFLIALGHDPSAGDLAGTGARVAEAWDADLLDGYRVDVAALLAAESFAIAFNPEASLVALRGSATAIMCPHHLLPATGEATVIYVPGTRVAGLGTIARVVDAFAHRLTLQERVGENVVAALMGELGARGAACALTMRHTCLTARGERQGAAVETLSASGVLAPGGSHASWLSHRTG